MLLRQKLRQKGFVARQPHRPDGSTASLARRRTGPGEYAPGRKPMPRHPARRRGCHRRRLRWRA
ncbi:hypothetical protein KCH_74910 [Kitasatospora cheerisanensis KCTC 2395]|uniref:Uncharacterized protein n=1 Tax=Kitasatospora cheerisanensis KCTC 2395 TaxID=1348663 RepID=A0A066YRL9_9ACTN|nr:hypothetical protein KCH_74910 [Kitasatospora cheerisanensis KCTC 2395]